MELRRRTGGGAAGAAKIFFMDGLYMAPLYHPIFRIDCIGFKSKNIEIRSQNGRFLVKMGHFLRHPVEPLPVKIFQKQSGFLIYSSKQAFAVNLMKIYDLVYHGLPDFLKKWLLRKSMVPLVMADDFIIEIQG